MTDMREIGAGCSVPPPLSEDALSTALDGAAPSEVVMHLQYCPGCTARLHDARRLEHSLSTRLHRWDCPPAAQLAEYHWGLLGAEQEQVLAGHIAVCPRCRAEVDELRAFLAEEAPVVAQTTPVTPARRRMGDLVARLLPSPGGLQPVGVRGTATGPAIAQCGAVTILLDRQPGGDGLQRVQGQIADEEGNQVRWEGALVEARQGNRLMASAFVDELGSFICGPLPCDVTDVRITSVDGLSILVEELSLF